jgi:hypothetical protein
VRATPYKSKKGETKNDGIACNYWNNNNICFVGNKKTKEN